MRTLGIALSIVIAIVVAATAARRVVSVADAAQTFRVATFNIHKGSDRRNNYNLERTIEAIDRLGVDLVGVQEAMRNHAGTNCDDQAALIARGLQRRSGRPWTHVYREAWITENRECLRRGRGDGVETEGLAFFTPERIVGSKSVRLSEGRIGLAVRVGSMPDVTVVVTHLAANRQQQADRARELGALLPWAAQHGRGLLIGDFNAEPNADELRPALARYRDGWADAAARGKTGGFATGQTRPHRVSRIDYVLYSPEIALTLESVDAIDTSALGLGEVSDHNPVVATFRRR